jgi:hypothetical protein
MAQHAQHAGAAVSDKWVTTVYRRCEKQCYKCRQCREFEALIDQIDLENKSDLDRQRDAEKYVRSREQS